ncbi:MAG TPA: RsmE family RNA methyltransferase [Gemmatimonadaceae bacterium]|nr:RsmE family RNA methyltransferase [Gemmatimonadaceae bacterium]
MERSDRATVATFFAPDGFTSGSPVTLGEDSAQHARVLRMGPGEAVALRDGQGRGASGILGRSAKKSLTIDVTDVWEIDQLSAVHMLVPVADRDRMLLLAEKCTELGATSWRPVMWRRSRSVGPAGDGPAFNTRIRARMISALIQSGGGWLPDIHPSAPVSRVIAAAPEGARLLLDAAGDPILSAKVADPVVVAIGPEGGFDAKERAEMVEAGFIPASLAGSTLRFETAGIAALSVVRAMLALGATISTSSGHADG